MDKKYELVLGKKRIKVSEEVYKAYYKEKEHEKYILKKALAHEYSLEKMLDEGISVEVTVTAAMFLPEEILLKEIELQAVGNAISMLNKEEKQLIQLYFFECKTERDIAEIMQISQKGVNKKKQSALNKLKKY